MEKSVKVSSAWRKTASTSVLAILVIVVFSAMSTKVYSQISIDDITTSMNVKLSKKAIDNLKAAIISDNLGVRRSAIFHAGYYRASQAAATLLKQLRIEKDPSTRILIALSLYKLNDDNALKVVKELSGSDSDKRVRNMCSAIYNEYLEVKSRIASK